MAPGAFLGDETLGGVLRAQVAHVDLHEGIAFLEQLDVIARVLAAPSVDEVELALLARAFFDAFFPLVGGKFRQSGVELL